MAQHLGAPREMQLMGQEGCHRHGPGPGQPVQGVRERRSPSAENTAGTRSHGAFRLDCSSFLTIYGPLEAAFPFVLPNKLTPDFQVSQGLGKHLSRLVPHFVFVSAAGIWALCADKRHPWGSAGVPTFCSPEAPAAGIAGWSLSIHRKSSLVPPCLKCHPILSLMRAPQGKNPTRALSVRQSHLVAVSLRCLGEGRRGSLCGLKVRVEGAEWEPEPNTRRGKERQQLLPPAYHLHVS